MAEIVEPNTLPEKGISPLHKIYSAKTVEQITLPEFISRYLLEPIFTLHYGHIRRPRIVMDKNYPQRDQSASESN